jgi:hypothetical protein
VFEKTDPLSFAQLINARRAKKKKTKKKQQPQRGYIVQNEWLTILTEYLGA